MTTELNLASRCVVDAASPVGTGAVVGPNDAWKLLTVLVLTAVLLRVAVALWLGPEIATRGNGIAHTRPVAMNLLAGRGYCVTPGVPSIYLEPGYPVFLGAAYAVFGKTWWAVALMQSLVAAATLLIAYRLAQEIFDKRSALVAVAILVVYPYFVMQSVGLIDTTLFTFGLLLCTHASYRAARSSQLWPALAAGVILGLALLCRKTIMLCVPVYVLMLYWPPTEGLAGALPDTRHAKRATTKLLLAMLAASIVLAPWLVRNYQLTGRFPLIAIHPIDGVWLGNNRHTQAFLEKNLSLDAIALLPEIRGSRFDPEPLHRRLPPKQAVAQAAFYRAEVWQFVVERPRDFLAMVPLRLWGLWSWSYNPRSTGGEPIPAWKQWAHRLSYGPVLMLALIAMAVRRRRWRRFWPLVAIMIFYTAGHLPAIGYSRLRLPMDCFLAILAASAITLLASPSPAEGTTADAKAPPLPEAG